MRRIFEVFMKPVATEVIYTEYNKANCREPMLSHSVPSRPWQKVGMDIFHFGHFDYLVITDYCSRWIERVTLQSKTASGVISKLKPIFARLAIPERIICDNMPYSSLEFRQFAKSWDFVVCTSSPLHPKSNGLAEKSVSIMKNMLRKTNDAGRDVYLSLVMYRNSPLGDVNLSPAQLIFGRRVRTKLPAAQVLFQPEKGNTSLTPRLQERQVKSKSRYDSKAREWTPLSMGDSVLLQNGRVWEPALITGTADTPRSYWVKNSNNRIVRSNRIMLRVNSNEYSQTGIELGDLQNGNEKSINSCPSPRPQEYGQYAGS
jgi:hypothetical protein